MATWKAIEFCYRQDKDSPFGITYSRHGIAAKGEPRYVHKSIWFRTMDERDSSLFQNFETDDEPWSIEP